MTRLPRPPADLIQSFQSKKWLERLTQGNNDFTAIAELALLVLEQSDLLPNARKLVGSSNITLTDAGAGTTVTINLSDQSVTPGTYNEVTVDQKGRVTAGANSTVVTGVINTDGTLTVITAAGSATVSLNLNHANSWTADQSVPDEAYSVTWNGSTEVPTKNAVYDKIESLPDISDDAYGVGWDGNMDGATKNAIYDAIESLVCNIPQYNSDPMSPAEGDAWVRRTMSGGSGGGTPYGLLLGLTKPNSGGSDVYELSYRTSEGTTKRVGLT